MYELLIKIMYELDYRKYTIQELSEMRAILEEFKGRTLEVNLKRIKEVEDVSAMGEKKAEGGSRLSL